MTAPARRVGPSVSHDGVEPVKESARRTSVIWVIGFLVALWSTGLFASAAPAASPVVEEHMEDVGRLLYRNAPMAPAPGLECTSLCDKLWQEEHRPMPNQPSSRALHQELRDLSRRTKALAQSCISDHDKSQSRSGRIWVWMADRDRHLRKVAGWGCSCCESEGFHQ